MPARLAAVPLPATPQHVDGPARQSPLGPPLRFGKKAVLAVVAALNPHGTWPEVDYEEVATG